MCEVVRHLSPQQFDHGAQVRRSAGALPPRTDGTARRSLYAVRSLRRDPTSPVSRFPLPDLTQSYRSPFPYSTSFTSNCSSIPYSASTRSLTCTITPSTSLAVALPVFTM